MKKSGFLFLTALLFVSALSIPNRISAQQTANPMDKKVTPTEVYYFHLSRRCVTCQTVEKVAKEAVNELFAEEVKKGMISFHVVNFEDKKNKDLIKKLKVSGQSLLVVHGKDQVDITDKGFMYAVNEPDKLKAEIKSQVETLSK